MSDARILYEIHYYEDQIEKYGQLSEKLGLETEELETLKSIVSEISCGFARRQKVRKKAVSDISGMQHIINMARTFVSEMEEFLNSGEYFDVCAGLQESERRIDEKIEEINREIMEYSMEIRNCENKLSDLYYQLDSAGE